MLLLFTREQEASVMYLEKKFPGIIDIKLFIFCEPWTVHAQ